MRENILYGRRILQEFLRKADRPRVNRVLISDSFPADLRRELPGLNAPVQEMPRRDLDRMFPDVNHQGIVLELAGAFQAAKSLSIAEAMELGGPFLMLDDISDPQNLGSILRTSEALGVRAVFASSKSAPVTPAVHRASSGASLHVPVYQAGNLASFAERLKAKNIWLAASVAEDYEPSSAQLFLSTTDLSRLPPAASVCLIIGSEGEGVKSILLSRADFLIHIPMHGQTASLNASVACGILLERIVNRS